MAADLWTLYWAFVAFVFGAVTGSFLNVCIWRLPQGQSLSDPPSHCPKCQHRLAFFPDMVPMLSQLWYRSRCRYCGVKFSWRYLGVELLTGLVFTAIYYRYVVFAPAGFSEVDANWSALAGMIFAAALVTIFFIDLDTYTIPDAAIALAVVVAVAKDIYLIANGHRPLLQGIPGTPWSLPLPLSVAGCLLAFWLLWQFAALTTALLGKEAMGGGDPLLLGAMAAFLIPWPLVVIAFIFAVALGTLGGLAGMWYASRAETKAAEADPDSAAPNETVDATMVAPGLVESAEPVADETLAGHRGVVELPSAPDEEPSAPELPASSRWGRLWTVAGTWVAVGGVWGGAVAAVNNLGLGIGIGAAAVTAA
ncbi:MAG: prepilin peptidase, partial [Actinomycetota bacterium]